MTEADVRVRVNGHPLVRVLLLVFAIATISLLHYYTDPGHVVWHGVYQRLYYAPIVVGAFWYGVPGGLLAATAAAASYVPHILRDWAGNMAYSMSQYAELGMFHLAGLLVGQVRRKGTH